jgi:hypothetical protein
VFNYIFLHLMTLGGNDTLIGTCLLMTCVAEIPLFWVAHAFIRHLGAFGTLSLSFLGFVMRCWWYASLTSAWWVLPAGTCIAHAAPRTLPHAQAHLRP